MDSRDGKDSTQRHGGRPTLRRGPLATALPALLVLCCLFTAAAPAGAAAPARAAAPAWAAVPVAAPPGFSVEAFLARLALQETELTAGDGASGDRFGCSVAVSGDTALVGASRQSPWGRSGAGAAYVFVRSGGAWTAQAKLTAGDGAAGDLFGYSVALSGDTALLGAPYKTLPGKGLAVGAAYVFTRFAGSWTQQDRLIAADGLFADQFGYSVALSGDTALVGAPWNSAAGAVYAGAAYVFTRSAGSWAQEAKPLAGDGAADDNFGDSVALSGDIALVGAPDHITVGQKHLGAAYVFTRSGGAWPQEAELTAAVLPVAGWFGDSVAVSGDTALVGAPYGAAYVFTRSGGAWPQQAMLTAAGLPEGDFGDSVALSGDTALVGRSGTPPSITGAAYVFTRSAGSWAQQDTLTAADGTAFDGFGDPVALSGETALVGAEGHSTAGAADAGAAYAFRMITAPTVTQLKPASARRGATVIISGASFGSAGTASFVKFGARKCATYPSWSDTQITCKVPAKAQYGKVSVTVTTTGGVSNAKRFTVKR